MSAAASTMSGATHEHGRESGRESVHSGRSSSKDNDRYVGLSTRHIHMTPCSSFSFCVVHIE